MVEDEDVIASTVVEALSADGHAVDGWDSVRHVIARLGPWGSTPLSDRLLPVGEVAGTSR